MSGARTPACRVGTRAVARPGQRTLGRQNQRGFAMLLVFLMAAVIAITLYMEIPRVSFESQRQKEGLLIERGEQYKRAIKVFVSANKRYPASIEELESFNNHRSLRKRYIDPMTGKSEWRIVHIGPGGVFTDSLVNKPKTDKDKDKDSQQSTVAGTIDPNNPNGAQGPSAVPKRRDSEIAGLCNGVMPGQTMPGQTGQTGQPGQPGVIPGMPGVPPGMPTGMPPGMPNQPFMPGQINPATGLPATTNPCPAGPLPGQPGYTGTGQTYPGQTYPGQTYPGQTYPGQTYAGQQPGMTASPYSTQPGAGPTGNTPFGQPGQIPAMPGMAPAGQANAQQLIQNLLTQPRPAGGFSGQPGQAAAGGSTIGGGIAGFASTADDEGIKVYNDKTNYKEWEFLYDYTKDTGVSGQQGANGTPVNQMGTQPGQTPGQTGQSPNGGAGATSPFGQSPGGFNQPSMFGPPPAPPQQTPNPQPPQ